MLVNEIVPTELNEQQMLMLRLLKTPLPDADFKQVQRLAVQLLAKQLDPLIEAWEEAKEITSKDYDRLVNNHFRSPAKE